MPAPFDWFHRTFTSSSTTEQLLGPELDNGLTRHDYELAVRFLPGPPRYLPMGYSFIMASLAAAYGLKYRRPPWSFPRAAFVISSAGFIGLMYGQFKQVQAHLIFAQSLENPATFMDALENVNRKTGGIRPLGFTLRNARQTRQSLETNGHTGDADSATVDFVPDNDWGDGQSTKKGFTSSPPSPPRRWEEIRAANARAAAKNSSWDALRQKYERERVQSSRKAENDKDNKSLPGNHVSEDPGFVVVSEEE